MKKAKQTRKNPNARKGSTLKSLFAETGDAKAVRRRTLAKLTGNPKDSSKWQITRVELVSIRARSDGAMALQIAWWADKAYLGTITITQYVDRTRIDSETMPKAFVSRVLATLVARAKFVHD